VTYHDEAVPPATRDATAAAGPAGPVRVGLVQMRCADAPAANLSRAIAGIEEAADGGADIVCLQELFLGRYPCQSEDPARFDEAEPVPGPSTAALGEVAARRGVVVVASLFERRAPGLHHNTVAWIDATGAVAGRYRKMHIPDDPLYYEKFYFAPGDLGFPTFPLAPPRADCAAPAPRAAALVCWDQWFPEAARLATLGGAELLFYPTAIGWQFDEGEAVDAAQLDAWETIQRAHAIANGCFVVAVNRVGEERLPGASGGIRFWGRSFVADPSGRVIARAPDDDEAVLVVDCDLRQVERTRRDWPFLRDRRIDAYADLARRFRDD